METLIGGGLFVLFIAAQVLAVMIMCPLPGPTDPPRQRPLRRQSGLARAPA